jgi:hypothetical protein
VTVVRLLTCWLVSCVVLVVISVLLPATAVAADDPAPGPSPLTVTLLRMTPSTVPAKGKIKLFGTVTNASDETWQDINVEPFVGSTPITTREELAAAADTAETVDVGKRLTSITTLDQIGDLSVGQTKHFKIVLPRSALPISANQPGVYWIGVHALGATAAGRDAAAAGRARTFIALVPKSGVFTSAALVLPVRAEVRRDSTGRLADPARWASLFAPDGRLDRVLNFGAGNPVTWLVDPAVLDAAQSMADGNPALSLGDATNPSGSPTESASASPKAQVEPTGETEKGNADDWLRRVKATTQAGSVLGLPYADPDVSALARLAPGLITKADDLATAQFTSFGLDPEPAVAPPSGYLASDVLTDLPSDTQLLLTDHGQPGATTQWSTPEGQVLTFADSEASSGGPAPTPALDALALRQRILAESALRAIAGLHTPMVTELPPHWDPGNGWRSADFFEGLNVPWLDVEPLSAPTSAATYPRDLEYPGKERKSEIGASNVDAALELIKTGTVLDHLLASDETDVTSLLTGAALSATSYDARVDPRVAANDVAALSLGVRDRMDEVKVSGTPFVTLSGGTGSLTVTLVNDLKVPVTVGLRAEIAESGVSIQAPKPVKMGAGQRTTLRLSAKATSIGVHQVTLTPVTTAGEALGTSLQFSLRTSQVGKLIWIVMIAGGVLLFGMIIRRIVKKVRAPAGISTRARP